MEYSQEWRKKIPKWIKIFESKNEIILENIPLSLSQSDLSIIRLAIEHHVPLASDDRPLRIYANFLGITIIGSLGLLKMIFQKGIIDSRE
jgi:predicted nucleic acid-binding protein